ncbi:MAG: carbohydrate-binding domain-containing protein [Roseburia sp.]|nr:carbohydrate-binding domain-containing protein [Roseburia sp.]MCM1098878.1 carbohydrate-binding domain-containing protein [Ruminococcus flavefaciens]
MSTHKHIDKICVLVTVFVLLLTFLFMNGRALGITVMASEDESDGMFTANDRDADWNVTGATEITLSDDGTIVRGNGAYVYNGALYIAYAGRYLISGELSDGNIIVSADGDDKIWLMFDGVSVHCEEDAALRVEQADKVFITLAEGTENSLSSGSRYRADATAAGVDGTIYSRDDLTINGSGSLRVTAGYQHGIVCNDDLVLAGGTLTIEAVQDGIHANDSVRIREAEITVSAGDDGITVSNDDETAFLYVESGKINILSCYEGLEAIDITIAGGTIDIRSTDDGINANGNGSKSVIRIAGGDITILNENGRDADGLDSNKDIYISGGRLLVSVADSGSNCAIDYGSENGGVCEISGGTVIACGGSTMAEGFDSSSPQGFLMYNTSAGAGTVVTLESADGSLLLSEEIPYRFSSLVVSTPEMAVGDTVRITVGGTATELAVTNSSNDFGFGRGGMAGGMWGGKGQDRVFGGRGSRDDGQMPGNDGQMPEDDGQMPGNDGRMPEDDGQMPGNDGQMPGNDGQMPGNDMQTEPPTVPEAPDEAPSGMPEAPENQGFGGRDDTQPVFSQRGGIFGGMQDGGLDGMQERWQDGGRGNRFGEGNLSQGADSDILSLIEKGLLIGVSAIVLVLGCVIALVFKRK